MLNFGDNIYVIKKFHPMCFGIWTSILVYIRMFPKKSEHVEERQFDTFLHSDRFQFWLNFILA